MPDVLGSLRNTQSTTFSPIRSANYGLNPLPLHLCGNLGNHLCVLFEILMMTYQGYETHVDEELITHSAPYQDDLPHSDSWNYDPVVIVRLYNCII